MAAKFLPVSGPLTSKDSTADSLDNIRVSGAAGFYPALEEGDVG